MTADRTALRVAIVGYGAIGRRRAATLGQDELVAVVDVDASAAANGVPFFASTGAMLDEVEPDVVVVSTPHHALAGHTQAALEAGCHVLVEKPGALDGRQLSALIELATRSGRRLWVGYNHRYHPAVAELLSQATSGKYGDVLFLRARYGHGGRPGYHREWRADPRLAGGGELIDQGVHLLDLVYALLGPVPAASSLLRTAHWPMDVEDNAVVVLADAAREHGPWAVLQLSCTEWKNEFVVDVYCRAARLTVAGLGRSYGRPVLTVHRRRPDGGVPDTEVRGFPDIDESWEQEWAAFRAAVGRPFDASECAGAQYALDIIDRCYGREPAAGG